MRLSRPCYDKPHRCPGWAGGGWKYPKDGTKYSSCEGGHMQIDWESKHWRLKRNWLFHRCDTCDVVTLPYNVSWTDPGTWRWKARKVWWRVEDWWWRFRRDRG